ncbi:hypothetical protein KAI52_01010 [Candidatus Parcubacteria bacterium]|nr:hypothetical protein [Candidatus Parcubacteria bacterium]
MPITATGTTHSQAHPAHRYVRWSVLLPRAPARAMFKRRWTSLSVTDSEDV